VSAVPEPRTWTIRIPAPCDWLTANIERHRFKRSKLVRQWREAVKTACKAGKLPFGVTGVDIACTVYYSGRRPVRDKLNLAPTIKACVDGLTPQAVKWRNAKPIVSVGYGFLPDDSDVHVRSTTWELATAASVGQRGNGVLLTITHLTERADSHCHEARDGFLCTAPPGEPCVFTAQIDSKENVRG
jgi:hypothetical protein